MNILHYNLGLPPYRSGGMTKYSVDLMKVEESMGNDISLLFPGHMKILDSKVRIRKYDIIDKIVVYELENPLPVPLMKGIYNPIKFMEKTSTDEFINFLKNKAIDVVHIHTIMGLYIEFLEACKLLDIKVVFTTHDYYGLCPKVNFLDYTGCICKKRDINKCVICNKYSADSILKIYLKQSRTYRKLREYTKIVKLVKRILKNNGGGKKNITVNYSEEDKSNFEKLIKYYEDMFNLIDTFFFNSDISEKIFRKYLKVSGEIIPITHNLIKDNRTIKNFLKKEKLIIGYLGSTEQYKGFEILKEVAKEIDENCDIEVYGKITIREKFIPKNIKLKGEYNYSMLKDIFNRVDVVIMPSIWYETYGFVILEALSYGVPVITTSLVGGKMLLKNEYGDLGIVSEPNKEGIMEAILKIVNNREILKYFNNNINKGKFDHTMNEHGKFVLECMLRQKEVK